VVAPQNPQNCAETTPDMGQNPSKHIISIEELVFATQDPEEPKNLTMGKSCGNDEVSTSH
jgi:hypothetical protein